MAGLHLRYQPQNCQNTQEHLFFHHVIMLLERKMLARHQQEGCQGTWLNSLKIRTMTRECENHGVQEHRGPEPLCCALMDFSAHGPFCLHLTDFQSYLEQPGRGRREQQWGKEGFSWLPAGSGMAFADVKMLEDGQKVMLRQKFASSPTYKGPGMEQCRQPGG